MSSSRQPPKLLDLDITIISAKHLKNVNWRHGDLKPFVAFWLEPGRRFTTKTDDSSSTRPVWNERFIVPINSSPYDTLLSLEITHSDTPTPLVGSLQFPLKDLLNSDESTPIRSLELRRPSGRPQGKIRLKLALRERANPTPSPDYHFTPQHNYYYSSAPPPPSRYSSTPTPTPYAPHIPLPSSAVHPPPSSSPYTYGNYSDPYTGYYSGYYSHPPPPPPRPFLVDQAVSGGVSGLGGVGSYSAPPGPTGPSAPVDYSSPYDHKAVKGVDYSSPYEHKAAKGSKLGVGAVTGALGGLTLEDGLKYEEDKIAAPPDENDLGARDDYSDYRGPRKIAAVRDDNDLGPRDDYSDYRVHRY